MFNPAQFENTRPDGIAVLEVMPTPGASEEAPRRFVPLRRTDLEGEIAGPLAAMRLTHHYRYARAECASALEAMYRFPLPGDAAVTGVTVRFGDVAVRAGLEDRREAEADYETAKREGRQAALLTREGGSVFTLQVTGLQPDTDIYVVTHYVQLARAHGDGWSLRVPLTTAPRYVRGDELGSRPSAGQPLAILRDPGHRFAMDLRMPGAEAVASPTHELDLADDDDQDGAGARVRLAGGDVVPDRDLVLAWRPAGRAEKPTLHIVTHDDEASGQQYFLAMVAPPAASEAQVTVARSAVVLVDHSGSMKGPKWAAADWAVKQFLADLAARDHLALGLFHSTQRWFADAPRPADTETVEGAVRFLERHRDTGGTELGVALEQALGMGRVAGECARHVLVITDAQVTDRGRVLRLAETESERADRRRISVLCIDAAPNSLLALELAERGGGVARFLTSDPGEDDITTALDEVLADWSRPVYTDLRLEVGAPGAQAVGRAVSAGKGGASLIDLGDLPSERPLWVAGRLPMGPDGPQAFRVLAGGRELAAAEAPSAGGASRPAVKALFGARRLLGLEQLVNAGYTGRRLAEHLRRLGYDPTEVLPDDTVGEGKVYAENVRRAVDAALRDLLVAESLSFGLVSSETAFVAVREEAGAPVAGTVVVANALPAGWSGRFVGGGAGAGTARAFLGSLQSSAGLMRGGPALFAPDTEDATDVAAESGALFERRRPDAKRPGRSAQSGEAVLFRGVPKLDGGQTVLFADDAAATVEVPDAATLRALRLRFPGGAPEAADLDRGLVLRLYVDDPAVPRATVRLIDLMRQGGERPLNVRRAGGPVRLVLVDERGAWAAWAPEIEVTLAW